MSVIIKSVEAGSIAADCKIEAGDILEKINGFPINDVLDYRFYMTEERIDVEIVRDGKVHSYMVEKDEYEDLGLDFETYLMDKQHSCRNRCIFCFVDQLPKGLRKSLYFKDDDSRMSFLFGSYVTLTNIDEEEIRRLIKMKISPINISVHTTNPELRKMMLKNPRAGETLKYIPMLTNAGIKVNTQMVLCPGINDGEEMRKSLYDLAELYPNLQSIALVPLGVTEHRERLYPLRPMTREEAANNLDIIEKFGEEMLKKHGERIAYPADEMFLIAGRPIPDADYYGEFEQLEDGVGIFALQKQELLREMEYAEGSDKEMEISLATGKAAEPLMHQLIDIINVKYPNIKVNIYGVENRLFGKTINVAGLLCAEDLAYGLKGKPLGKKLLIPSVMLRHEQDKFLDDHDVPWLSEQLGVPVQVSEVSGIDLFYNVTEEE